MGKPMQARRSLTATLPRCSGETPRGHGLAQCPWPFLDLVRETLRQARSGGRPRRGCRAEGPEVARRGAGEGRSLPGQLVPSLPFPSLPFPSLFPSVETPASDAWFFSPTTGAAVASASAIEKRPHRTRIARTTTMRRRTATPSDARHGARRRQLSCTMIDQSRARTVGGRVEESSVHVPDRGQQTMRREIAGRRGLLCCGGGRHAAGRARGGSGRGQAALSARMPKVDNDASFLRDLSFSKPLSKALVASSTQTSHIRTRDPKKRWMESASTMATTATAAAGAAPTTWRPMSMARSISGEDRLCSPDSTACG